MDKLTLGYKGESFVYQLFERAGRGPSFSGPADIRLADGLTIEVKASLPSKGKRKRFQFCLFRKTQDGVVKTDARRADLLILLAYKSTESAPVIFVIPNARLNGGKSIKLPADLGKYSGKWSWFAGFNRAVEEVMK